MRKYLILLLILLIPFLLLSGCKSVIHSGDIYTLEDWTGHSTQLSTCPQRVIALSASLGEVWLLAGGTLCGITEDAVEQQRVADESMTIVGSIKEPNLEQLLALEPDFVILSADIASHQTLADTLADLSIPYGLFHEEYFADYLHLLAQFTAITGRNDLFEANGTDVQTAIETILNDSTRADGKTALLLRAYSSGCRAKDSENLAGVILRDFGFDNVMDHYDTPLEELSMEELLRLDPDYIFLTTMGTDTEAALEYMRSNFQSDPAWQSLSAVKAGNYHVLPKDLFHNKPNARWDQAYEYIATLLSE